MSENQEFLALTRQTDLPAQLEADMAALAADAADDLVALVADDAADLERRWRSAVILGKRPDGAAGVDALLGVLGHSAWEMRHSAVWSLCQIGDARAYPALLHICTDGKLDEQVNYVAALGIARQYGAAGRAALEANLSHDDETVRAWARAALAAVSYL
ncbi:MAG: HEAT repeat domain-containing protein [Pleurocapsa minor GSE-CHR-MK-17-07R]|nr:HEAT repeat domain-containing protein [Pleurocapsa minor GSE-CHR-MK 17-07R]